MVCFTILGGHEALNSDEQNPPEVMPLSSETPTFVRTGVVISPLPVPPWGAGMVCFTILGGHDALKDDKQSPAKVMPLSSGMPTYDANRCRHPTLTCPPLASWNAVFYNTWWT